MYPSFAHIRLLVLVVSLVPLAAVAQTPSLTWVEQFGTSASDNINGVASDGAGGTYVAGQTAGALGGPNQGGDDAFVARYDASGTQLWIRQLGTSGVDVGYSVANDDNGGVLIGGFTTAAMPGESYAGGFDLWVARYDAAGNLSWVRQLGSSGDDYGHEVSSDGAGGAFIVGYTNGVLPGASTGFGGKDAFIVHYNSVGTLQWVRMIGGAADEQAWGVAPDGAGGALVAGDTQNTLPGSSTPNQGDRDLFVVRYDAAGTALWVRMIGTSGTETAGALTSDGAGGAVAVGNTNGTLPGSATANQGSHDAFAVRYDASGNLVWVDQYGSSSSDIATDVEADGGGGYVIAGYSEGTMPGASTPNTGGQDAYVAVVDGGGVLQAVETLGTGGTDQGMGVASNGAAGVYVGGYTDGAMPGETSAGSSDAFLARFDPSCTGAAPAWDGTVVTGGDSNRYLRVEADCGLDWVEFWNTDNINLDGIFVSGDGGTSFTPAIVYSAYSTGSCNVAEPGLTDCQGYEYSGSAGGEETELWVRVSPNVQGESSTFFLALTDTEGTTTNIDPVLEAASADVLPEEPVLHAAYPNPFNPTTRIAFSVPHAQPVHLAVYDVLGRRVATLFDGPAQPGRVEATWHGRDAAGAAAASGVYLIRLETAGAVRTQTITLIK